MYDCETGDEYVAYTQEDHEKFAALGYVHDIDTECGGNGGDNGNGETESQKYEFVFIGIIAMAVLAHAFLGGE